MNINWILLTLTVIGVIILYRKYQEQPEEGLILKLFFYNFLGAFQFRLQGFPLPVGFLIYGFFLRPKTNITIKKGAATLGLGLLFLSILIPGLDKYYFERTREVVTTSHNLYSAKLYEDWRRIKAELDIQGDDRLDNFNIEYEKNGNIKAMWYEVTTNSEGKYVHYSMTYSPEKSQYLVLATKLEQWIQYDRLIKVDRFFEVYNKINLMSIKDMKDLDYYRIRFEGRAEEYGIKETKNLLLEGDKFVPLNHQQLPIQGYYIWTYGMVGVSQSKDSASYQSYNNKCFIFQY